MTGLTEIDLASIKRYYPLSRLIAKKHIVKISISDGIANLVTKKSGRYQIALQAYINDEDIQYASAKALMGESDVENECWFVNEYKNGILIIDRWQVISLSEI